MGNHIQPREPVSMAGRKRQRNGAYQFTNCRKGITVAGTGIIKVKLCKVQLQAGAADHSVSALVNICTHAGNASIQVSARTFTISDKDTTNNTCGWK